MLTEICAEIKNYFSKPEDKVFSEFSVIGGQVMPPLDLEDGQYYRIIGSVFNDGVHRQGDTLTDESMFEGSVWVMRVPQAVIDLDTEITAWIEKNADVIDSPYQSESFGGYSYSKASGGAGNSTNGATWQNQFAKKLNLYRRIRV